MKAQATTLYPFVPSGPDFEVAIAFFAELGFAKQWQHEGLAGLASAAPTSCCRSIDVPEWQKNQMITYEVDDLEAYWSQIDAKNLPPASRRAHAPANRLPLGPRDPHHRPRGRVLARAPGEPAGLTSRALPSGAGGATDRPTTLWRSISRATRPEAFASSTNVAQEGRAGRVLARRADRLLHGGELAVEDARAGQLLDVGDQPRPQAGERVELVGDELLVGAVEGVGPHQRGVLDVAVEPEAVGAAPRHGDAHARLVDVGDGLDRRAGRHQVGRLDLAVGGGEGDLLGALRLGADQADVPGAGVRPRRRARPAS